MLSDVNTLDILREDVIQLFHHYTTIVPESKYKAITETQVNEHPSALATQTKILAKQILQRLLIELAQVKRGYASEYSLNQIR